VNIFVSNVHIASKKKIVSLKSAINTQNSKEERVTI
jgi:hypothetical protein